MAVDDIPKFHKDNMHMNKKHYTVFSRFTHGRAVKLAQKYGAKCHFNEISMPIAEFTQKLEDKYDFPEDKKEINFRYGIIGVNDLVRDLKYWETLLVSSMMQRPIKKLIDSDPSYHIWDEA